MSVAPGTLEYAMYTAYLYENKYVAYIAYPLKHRSTTMSEF